MKTFKIKYHQITTTMRTFLNNKQRGNIMIRQLRTLLVTLLIGIFAIPALANDKADNTDEKVRTIEVIGQDNMRFDVEEINAAPGETIRIKFTVKSNIPPVAMKHNLAIVDKDADIDAFVNASMTAKDNEYIAPDMEDQVIATTKMMGGGGTDTIEFTVPEEPGEYPYVCTFPGHYMAGMKGMLTVKDTAS